MSVHLLTSEQADIVEKDVRPGQTLKINALAGTGKTTTLTAYADARPTHRFLYLAFNAAAAADAKTRFPINTVCKTVHALAFGQVGRLYEAKLARGKIRPNVVQDFLGGKLSRKDAQAIMATVEKYLTSADVIIRGSHTPEDDKVWDHIADAYSQKEIDKDKRTELTALIRSTVEQQGMSYPEAALKVLEDAEILDNYTEEKLLKMLVGQQQLLEQANSTWNAMQDVQEMRMPIPHDGYLKLYQLTNPKLSYDGIFLDEGQDTNPVTLAIFNNQKTAFKLIVGDRYQSIYAFRGATNAMAKVKAEAELYLTTSFRFGQAIADTANVILRDFHNEKHLLKGLKTTGGCGYVDKGKPYTMVARTNGMLFREAYLAISTAQTRGKNCSVGFIATLKDDNFNPTKPYGLDLLMDVYHLWKGDKHLIRDPYIGRFANFQELLAHATNPASPDMELASKARLVEEFKDELPDKIDTVVNNSTDPKVASILFTSAHRAKGLEWNQVVLADDFIDLVENENPTEPNSPLRPIETNEETEQELNLLYVAATRAKSVLQINAQLHAYLEVINERTTRQAINTPQRSSVPNPVEQNAPEESSPNLPPILNMKTDKARLNEPGILFIGSKPNSIEHFGIPLELQSNSQPHEKLDNYKNWLDGTSHQEVAPEQREWILKQLPQVREAKALIGFHDAPNSHGNVLIEKAFDLKEEVTYANSTPNRESENPEDVVLHFGAHRGKTLMQVDEKYLRWLVEPFIGQGKKYPVPQSVSEAAADLLDKMAKGIELTSKVEGLLDGVASEKLHLKNNFEVESEVEEAQNENDIKESSLAADAAIAALF